MAKYVQWITHRGVKMRFMNAKGLPEAEYVAAFGELRDEILKEEHSSPVLVDLSNTSMTKKVRDAAKEVAEASKKTGLTHSPSAIVGLSMLSKMVAQLLEPGTHYAESIDEAKDWLADQATKHR